MGLDVIAYRKLTKIDAVFDRHGTPINPETREEIDGFVHVQGLGDFPTQATGLDEGAVYQCSEAEYVFVMSYGGYSRWREQLAKLAGYPATGDQKLYLHSASAWYGVVEAGSPFYELVNFTDGDGWIGPVVAAKLHKDFTDFNEKAANELDHDDYEAYCCMMRGLAFASDGGALSFH